MVMDGPHRRFNALTGEWVLVSAGRTDRPWQGSTEDSVNGRRQRYEPDCYLCPGNRRANGAGNPDYDDTFVFTNDFAALRPDEAGPAFDKGLLRAESTPGTCRVICYSPRHDVDMASMEVSEIRAVVDVWAAQTRELGEHYRWVQVFENRGAAMGASNPHPHGQVWASDSLPVESAKEDANQRAYRVTNGRILLLDYLAQELEGPRVVAHNDSWVALVPFWAVWPFELLVLPRRQVSWMPDLSNTERDQLAELMSQTLAGYDRVFDCPFPYSMGWHGSPGDSRELHWQLHAHFYPPLLRSATVRKHMVGYELLSEPQRDITPEEAAQTLRDLVAVGRSS